MQKGPRGRVLTRVVVVVAIVVATVAGMAFFGGTTMNLAEITWSYSGQ